MREMKDSGVEWIGKIPQKWNIERLRDIKAKKKYSIVDGPFGSAISTSDYREIGIPLIRITNLKNGEISEKDMVYISRELAESVQRSSVGLHDIIFAKTGATIGKCGINKSIKHGILASSCVKISISNELDYRFFYYFFSTEQFNEALRNTCTGTTRDTINLSPFSKLNVVVPTYNEQCRIADYLDRKCSQIDAIIARQLEVIENLKAYKMSVITEAVTKGLNSDVPMKDSGVEWIGQIPEHWVASVLRYGLENIQTGPFGSQLHAEDYIEDGIFVINPANIVEGGIVPDNRCSITESKAQELSRHILNKGDIIFARRGEMGRCACFGGSSQQYLCGTGCIKIQCNSNFMPEFVSWFLQTSCVKQYLTLNSVGTTMANLNTTIISGIPIVFPPVSEQKKIVEYIKNKICEVDRAVKNKSSIVNKLTEYKKSLIYEIVTGKKEV